MCFQIAYTSMVALLNFTIAITILFVIMIIRLLHCVFSLKRPALFIFFLARSIVGLRETLMYQWKHSKDTLVVCPIIVGYWLDMKIYI